MALKILGMLLVLALASCVFVQSSDLPQLPAFSGPGAAPGAPVPLPGAPTLNGDLPQPDDDDDSTDAPEEPILADGKTYLAAPIDYMEGDDVSPPVEYFGGPAIDVKRLPEGWQPRDDYDESPAEEDEAPIEGKDYDDRLDEVGPPIDHEPISHIPIKMAPPLPKPSETPEMPKTHNMPIKRAPVKSRPIQDEPIDGEGPPPSPGGLPPVEDDQPNGAGDPPDYGPLDYDVESKPQPRPIQDEPIDGEGPPPSPGGPPPAEDDMPNGAGDPPDYGPLDYDEGRSRHQNCLDEALIQFQTGFDLARKDARWLAKQNQCSCDDQAEPICDKIAKLMVKDMVHNGLKAMEENYQPIDCPADLNQDGCCTCRKEENTLDDGSTSTNIIQKCTVTIDS